MKAAPPKLPALAKCERHQAIAGWECSACHHALCPDCVAEKVMYPVSMVACVRCGNHAEPLVRLKMQAASLADRVPGAFTFPFTIEGGAAWLGIALWVWLCSFGGMCGAVFGVGGAIAAFFGLTRSTANGHEHIELTDFSDPLTSVGLPLVRFAAAMIPAWGGALAAMYLHQTWLLWVAGALTLVWSPTAFIGAATGANFVHMLNPLRVLKASAALGKDFAVYLGSLFALLGVFLAGGLLALLIDKFLWVPVLAGVTERMALLYAPFVGARVAGLVLHLHGPVFGWGEELDRYEPVLRDAVPRGTLEDLKPTEKPRMAPIELEPEPAAPLQTADVASRFGALEADPDGPPPPEHATLDVSLLPSHAEQSAEEIRRAIKAGDHGAALDGFRATGLTSAEALSFDELLWLGQTAAAQIDHESAELGFRAALKKSGAPSDGVQRARVMLGRLLGEKLSRVGEGRELMSLVVAEAPGTSAATFATQWLEKHVG